MVWRFELSSYITTQLIIGLYMKVLNSAHPVCACFMLCKEVAICKNVPVFIQRNCLSARRLRGHVTPAKCPPSPGSSFLAMEEVYVSFDCTAKLHYRGPQLPREHKCRLSLGTSSLLGGTCIEVEGTAFPRRKFRVSFSTMTKPWPCHIVPQQKEREREPSQPRTD